MWNNKDFTHHGPLTQVLAGKLAWETVQQAAFDQVKRALATATTLVFPHTDGSLSITTDASDMAIGVVLQTHHVDSTRPLAFISKTRGVCRISQGGGPTLKFLGFWIYMLLLGGFGGMLPQENFKKWCNFVRFEGYFQPLSW